MKNDDFGDRMKAYEATETKRKFTPMLPIIARIDGRSFSKFTKHFDKPFDSRLTSAMQDTCVMLVEATNASIGYVQSDEITLIFYSDDYDKPIFFDGRVQKMVSVLAGMATAYFIRNLDMYATWSENVTTEYSAYPHFDARVWQVPTKTEAANALLWRCQDARRNGVSSACRSMFSTKQMFKKSQLGMIAMMKDKGVDYNTTYSVSERFGSLFKRERNELGRNSVQPHCDRAYFGDNDAQRRETIIFGEEDA
jgi:tRNA(His) 5'-end guanylyltransferase